MSEFLRHEPCDSCGSSDARAVFTDGHKYCFSCQAFTPADTEEVIKAEFTPRKNKKKSDFSRFSGNLPATASYSIEGVGLDWLRQYGITDKEIAMNQIMWAHAGYRKVLTSQDGVRYGHFDVPCLVFPFYDADKVLRGWQGRTFTWAHRTLTEVPKYVTFKDPEFLPIYANENDKHTCVLVEDIISAIKVSRVFNAMPLLGSSLSKTKLVELSKLYRRLVLWLDPDMLERSFDLQKDAEPFFDKVEVVTTLADPKTYSEDTIAGEICLDKFD